MHEDVFRRLCAERLIDPVLFEAELAELRQKPREDAFWAHFYALSDPVEPAGDGELDRLIERTDNGLRPADLAYPQPPSVRGGSEW